ncbi:MAG: tetratricopeptide repeat protein [Anaerolineae bacterium]|jgi:hypothetical protein|nr:tetratricopeptide repeat protein [Anaerolineae bacterium]
MSDTTHPELTRAFQLIENEQLGEARTLLDRYLAAHPDDVDAWWLYAHAVAEPAEGQRALEKVLALDPAYPGAKSLQAQLSKVTQPSTPTAAMTIPARIEPIRANTTPDFLDDLDEDDFEDDFDSEDSPIESTNRRWLLMIGVGAIILVVIGIALLSVLNNNNVTPTSTPPSIANNLTPTVNSTFPTSTPSNASGAESAVISALGGYALAPGSETPSIETTSAGQTLTVSVCSTPSEVINTLFNVMEILAGQNSIISTEAEAIGVRVVNCQQNNRELVNGAIPLSVAQQYSNGEITTAEFRARFRPM